ncbi:MAG: hypothetical protein OXN89_24520 [Bryobacterales bacterium]|nr:hypothetical protein [Bryobacterales bacterium]
MARSRSGTVNNWSGRDLDEDLDLWAREERERVLDRTRIFEAFERLDGKLEKLGLRAVVHLAGSAPLLLDGSRERLTREVDALRIEHAGRREEFASAVRETAAEMGLRRDWLNLNVSLVPGMPPRPDGGERAAYRGKCLRAIAPSDRQLLAMKFRAHRQQDWDDMRILARRVGAATFGQVRDIHDKCFPRSPYSMFADIEKEYLAGELPRRLAEWRAQRPGESLTELGRKAQGAGREPGPTRSR